MGVVQLFQYAVLDSDDTRQVKMGSLTEARSIALNDDAVMDETFNVAPGTAIKIFDHTSQLGNFLFLWLECDFDVLVEFVSDAGASNAYDVKTLKGSGTAGTFGSAMVLGSDVSQKVDGAVNEFNGSASVIGQVWVKNQSATQAARVRMMVAN